MVQVHRTRVKICGIRSLAEALAAVDCGAEAIGFNFFDQSVRFLRPKMQPPLLLGYRLLSVVSVSLSMQVLTLCVPC